MSRVSSQPHGLCVSRKGSGREHRGHPPGKRSGSEQANMAQNPYFLPAHPVGSDAQTYLEKMRTPVLGLLRATESFFFLGNLKQEKIK